MAQTLASGVVIPAPGDRISAAGVQEMRTLGASVDTGLSLAHAQVAQVDAQVAQADAQSRARDRGLEDQIAGMEGMTYVGAWESGRTYRINEVVTHGGDSWARLTAGSAGEPGASPTDWGLVARKGDGGGFGELTETGTPGLYETVDNGVEGRLAALEYDSGVRNIAGLIRPGYTVERATVERAGRTVTLAFEGLIPAASGSGFPFNTSALPEGFRPAGERPFQAVSTSGAACRMAVRPAFGVGIYGATAGTAYVATVTYLVPPALPATLPGI